MFQELNDNQMRQYIDAKAAFMNFAAAKEQAKEVRGGMYWKKVGKHEYLTRTNTSNNQKIIGTRTPENEEIYARFMIRKQEIELRAKTLKTTVQTHQRMNRALQIGRAPNLVVKLLNILSENNLLPYFTVIGTFALYAYESAAGIRIESEGALQTQDVDILWHIGKRVQFFIEMNRTQEKTMIALLRKVDPTFQPSPTGSAYSAINDQSFEVEFIRAPSKNGEPHPISFSDEAEHADLAPVGIVNMERLMSAKRMETVVVAVSGEMALMPTIPPDVFYKHKYWLAEQKNRDPLKMRRDRNQAVIVECMVREYLPQYLPEYCCRETTLADLLMPSHEK